MCVEASGAVPPGLELVDIDGHLIPLARRTLSVRHKRTDDCVLPEYTESGGTYDCSKVDGPKGDGYSCTAIPERPSTHEQNG